jgi:hypothetical protein
VSTQALAIASTAVAGGVNGSAFTLAHQVLRGVKMLAIQKAAAVVATVAIVGSGSVVAVNRVLLAQAPANLPPPLPTTIATTRTITANPAASPPAFNGKTVIDYIFVFENMQATKDLRAELERGRDESLQAERDRLEAVKKLRDQRDAAPKGSAEFDRLDKEFNAALEKNKAERKAAELKTRRDSIRAMAEQFQRMEAAIQEVGKTHGLSLPPASKPAYPPHVDAVDQNQIRALVLRRFLPRPKDAADLTQEVLKYLDDHPDISVAGLPDAPPGTPAPVIPEARPILQTGSTAVQPTSRPATKP